MAWLSASAVSGIDVPPQLHEKDRDNEEPKRTNKTGKLSAQTMNAVRSALSAILEDPVLQGCIRHNPVKDVHRLAEYAERC